MGTKRLLLASFVWAIGFSAHAPQAIGQTPQLTPQQLKERQGWNLSGTWQCDQGCDIAANPRHIVQVGANLTLDIKGDMIARVIWMGEARVYIAPWNNFLVVESPEIVHIESASGTGTSRWVRLSR